MPPKQKLPAPIDRPLSRAYLREFSGWSTAFPPGLSEPTSLRIMENTMVNRDGSLRIRPGLRYLTYDGMKALSYSGVQMVGSHEVFFLNNGDKAYLFAVREVGGGLGFRAAQYRPDIPERPFRVLWLDNAEIGFTSLPADLGFQAATTYVKYLQIDNKIIALSNAGEIMRIFSVGATKKVSLLSSITRPSWTVGDKTQVKQPNQNAVTDPSAYNPWTNYASATSKTLAVMSSEVGSIPYNVGYFYTFSNDVGESAPSQVDVRKVRRRWGGWIWQTPNSLGEPSGTDTADAAKAADQLAVWPGQAAFDAAKAQGATKFNLYAATWSDQDPVPVEGVLVGSKDITSGMNWVDCWVRHSAVTPDTTRTMALPSAYNRVNYSNPSTAGQGIVAADRLVLVNDPAAGAVIRWTANLMGEYTNFTANRGGGYKTLTSGNLYIPACVKLWQNPESKDTLTILCLGVDGYSSSYYMAPAQVASQSDTTNIMGFEETTATPGTTSPYGCEVLNNALYHPLETELTKSTASNYNINHKPMTDLIANMWRGLVDKDKIVSSQLDNRLYYIVHNPHGEPLQDGCWGNEVWVCDTAVDGGSWSRWLVQGQSLRKIELEGQVVMSIVRPEGLYCFDENRVVDEYVDPADFYIKQRPIPWRIETNTQGANRAHDAWAHLQQAGVILGNFVGTMRWGIRGWDVNGKRVDVAKLTRDLSAKPADGLPFDLEDFLPVRRDMKEWRFYAESVEQDGATLPSEGQINLVQYRYTPVSVNVGYEYGSVETFEYARNNANGNNSISVNGVPVPMADSHRA